MNKQTRWLLEQALYKLTDTKQAIEEGTWANEDDAWKTDLDILIKKIVRELGE